MNFSYFLHTHALLFGTIAVSLEEENTTPNKIRLIGPIVNGGNPSSGMVNIGTTVTSPDGRKSHVNGMRLVGSIIDRRAVDATPLDERARPPKNLHAVTTSFDGHKSHVNNMRLVGSIIDGGAGDATSLDEHACPPKNLHEVTTSFDGHKLHVNDMRLVGSIIDGGAGDATSLDKRARPPKNLRKVDLIINGGSPDEDSLVKSATPAQNIHPPDLIINGGNLDLASGLYVRCWHGIINAYGSHGMSCYAACDYGTSCCGGFRACEGFTGLVAKDGSCMGNYACASASVRAISGASCNGVHACSKVGSGEGAAVDSISGASCVGDEACHGVGLKGQVGRISDNSCIGDEACKFLGYTGVIGDVDTGSCNGIMMCKDLARGGSIGNLHSCCNDPSENCSAMEGNGGHGGLPDGGLPVRCSIPAVCRSVTINLPATTTNQLVHGICVNTAQGAQGALASSSLSGLDYTPVSFTGSPRGWGDCNYVLQGVESVTECNDGEYLRPSLIKAIPSGTEISISVAPWSSTVCVFFKNIDMDGGWSSNLDETWVTKDYDDFGGVVHGEFYPLMTRCHDINQ